MQQNTTDLTTGEAASPLPVVFDRYYHMFAKGELNDLVAGAASKMGLVVGAPLDGDRPGVVREGVQIVQDGWERSNYYVELRCWKQ